MKAYDKNRREIMVNDVLKVYHFTGRRRKKYFMYKIVKSKTEKFNHGQFLIISHLPMSKGDYNLLLDGKVHEDIEIVQGYHREGNVQYSFYDRKRFSD